MSENAEQRSGNVENLETGGTAVPPVSSVPANDLDGEPLPEAAAAAPDLTAPAPAVEETASNEPAFD